MFSDKSEKSVSFILTTDNTDFTDNLACARDWHLWDEFCDEMGILGWFQDVVYHVDENIQIFDEKLQKAFLDLV